MRWALTFAALALAGLMTTSTWSAWVATTSTAASTFTAKADWQAPALGTSVVAKSTGGTGGYIHQGGSYYLYANVADGGNPASGTTSVQANAGTLSTGQTASPLTAGSFSVEGLTYGYRSALLTANAALAENGYATTVSTADQAGNTAAALTGPAVTVDNTQPAGSNVRTANGGAVALRPDAGDTVTYTFTEAPDSYSILPGWTGAATTVAVAIVDSAAKDAIQIWNSAGTTQLPLGSVNTNGDYVTATAGFLATMVQSGTTVVFTLNSLQQGTVRTATGNGTMTWSPATVAGATDRAGNALLGTTVNESGTANGEF
jgi:chitinase